MTSSRSFIGHAVLVGALTFLSRVFGLVRDAVLAACFGMSTVADAFWIGFLVPNLFRRLFGEGALTSAFIPIYTRLGQQDPGAARRFAWLCVAGLTVLLSTITLAGELALGVLATFKSHSPDTTLAIHMTMVMLPYMPMICVVALLGAVLQVHHRFGPSAWAPVVLNLVTITAAILAAVWQVTAEDPRKAIWVVALSVLVGGVIQVLVVGWQAVRVEPMTTVVHRIEPSGAKLGIDDGPDGTGFGGLPDQHAAR